MAFPSFLCRGNREHFDAVTRREWEQSLARTQVKCCGANQPGFRSPLSCARCCRSHACTRKHKTSILLCHVQAVARPILSVSRQQRRPNPRRTWRTSASITQIDRPGPATISMMRCYIVARDGRESGTHLYYVGDSDRYRIGRLAD
jgi:hypothetical protein